MIHEAARTIGQIVGDRPDSARVLERFGINCCSQERTTLSAACARGGVDLEAVVRALDGGAKSDAPDGVDWGSRPLGELVEHITVTHHAFTRDEIERARGLALRVLAAHGAKYPEIARTLATFAELREELLPHLECEERVLFPYLRQLARGGGRPPGAVFGSVRVPLRAMQQQHDACDALLTRLREQCDGYGLPPDACPTWRALWASLQALEADLHRHIRLENEVLFPRALEAEASLR